MFISKQKLRFRFLAVLLLACMISISFQDIMPLADNSLAYAEDTINATIEDEKQTDQTITNEDQDNDVKNEEAQNNEDQQNEEQNIEPSTDDSLNQDADDLVPLTNEEEVINDDSETVRFIVKYKNEEAKSNFKNSFKDKLDKVQEIK